MSDFSADMRALTDAAAGITSVAEELGAHDVHDIDCAAAAFGHDKLAATVREFCDRWQLGVQNLTRDGAQIAQLLTDTCRAYAQADSAATDVLRGAAAGLDTPPGSPVGGSGREVA